MALDDLLENEDIQSMITHARLDYGLEYEISFVIGVAFLNGLLKPGFTYTKDLLFYLRFAVDDLSASLRIDQLSRDWNRDRFERFADKFGIDLEKLQRAREIAQLLFEPCLRFSKGIKPRAVGTQIDACTNLFTKAFMKNPCLYTGEGESGEFFDYEKGFYFNVSEQSRLYYSPALRRLRPCVYYRMIPTQNHSHYVAPFLCVVPVRLITALKYSKIFIERFVLGVFVARRFLRNQGAFNRRSDDPGYLSIRKYDHRCGTLDVLCTNNSRQNMRLMICEEIVAAAEELKLAEHRHFWLSRYQTNSLIGQSLQVLDILLNSYESDSLCFIPKGNHKMNKKSLAEFSRMLKEINPYASCTIFHEEESERWQLIATFPTAKDANDAHYAIWSTGNDGFCIEPYSLKGRSDFFGRTPKIESDYANVYEEAPCIICLTPPEINDVLRLLLCGHTFCTNCFMQMINHARRFPIKCAGSDCVSVVVFDDLDLAFNRHGFKTKKEMDEFLEPVIAESLEYFLRTPNSGYKKCMAAGCDGIIDVAKLLRGYNEEIIKEHVGGLTDSQKQLLSNVPVSCERCWKSRCGICGFDFHTGIDCQEFYATNFVYNNEELAKWKRDNPSTRRFCPNNECHILMEKVDGCNHIQCTACHTHFCWLCKDFQTQESGSIYEHMTKMHGGSGLAEDFFIHLLG